MIHKIYIKVSSKIHRKILNSFKEENNTKTDSKAILEIIERFKLQEIELKELKNTLKTQAVKLSFFSKNALK